MDWSRLQNKNRNGAKIHEAGLQELLKPELGNFSHLPPTYETLVPIKLTYSRLIPQLPSRISLVQNHCLFHKSVVGVVFLGRVEEIVDFFMIGNTVLVIFR